MSKILISTAAVSKFGPQDAAKEESLKTKAFKEACAKLRDEREVYEKKIKAINKKITDLSNKYYKFSKSSTSAKQKVKSLDEIRKLVKPVCTKLAKAKTDTEFESILDSFGSYSATVDKYFSQDINGTADKVHYQQNLDADLSAFLKTLE